MKAGDPDAALGRRAWSISRKKPVPDLIRDGPGFPQANATK
jgi:hypothetical protein